MKVKGKFVAHEAAERLDSANFATTMCVCLILTSAHISLSDSGVVCGIFIYDLLLGSKRMIFFLVKKFVERKFSPLTEKNSRGKNYYRDRSVRKQFLNTR